MVFRILSLIFVATLFLSHICMAEEKTPLKQREELPEQAKRLGISNPSKSMRFGTVKSRKYEGEEYDIVIDEKTLKETPFTKEEIEKTLKDAMDSRIDRREDSAITIEVGEKKQKENDDDVRKNEVESPKEKSEVSDSTRKLVGKIKKKQRPVSAHQDSKSPKVKDLPIDGKRFLRIEASGACEQQNKGLADAVRFEQIT